MMPEFLATTRPQPKAEWLDDDDDDQEAVDWSEEAKLDDADNDNDSGDDDEEEAVRSMEKEDFFPKLLAQIEAAIESLGGDVFVKLNWSSPKDAVWVTTGETLRCNTVGDVLLLLKSSDFIARDLSHAYDECDTHSLGLRETHDVSKADKPPPPEEESAFHLVLRRWSNLHPSREFRCFVRGRRLVAVCQRDYTQHFEELNESDARRTFVKLIGDFFRNKVRDKFELRDYVFDAYVDRKLKVFLVDFGTFGGTTDSLLFEWDELAKSEKKEEEESKEDDDDDDDDDDRVMWRVVETPNQIRPNSLAAFRMPHDLVDLSNSSAIDDFVRRANDNIENLTET
eukprot:TRINITY_DN67078_c4_g1_i1.p1 TRINITY_DN67078_c4_g1~~TRINITY_DN67078_c4_g1_i1.p1  ORF type:complete len:340 (-),score=203.87 TRINITY_DN67078_c4_g1_i1:32-1051(-)